MRLKKGTRKPKVKRKRVVIQPSPENREQIVKKHGGEFAATDSQGCIVAFGKTPASAIRQAHKVGEKDPTLFRISETACIWAL